MMTKEGNRNQDGLGTKCIRIFYHGRGATGEGGPKGENDHDASKETRMKDTVRGKAFTAALQSVSAKVGYDSS